MKKILSFALILGLIFPMYGYAEENTEKEIITQKTESRTFIQFGTNLFSNPEQKTRVDGKKVSDNIENLEINNSGYISFGTETYSGVQIYLTPRYLKEEEGDVTRSFFGMELDMDIPFFNSRYPVKPFISGGFSMDFANLEDSEYETDDVAFGFRFGFGVKIDINEDVFAKIGAYYAQKEYEFELEDYDIKIDQSGIVFKMAFGCKF